MKDRHIYELERLSTECGMLEKFNSRISSVARGTRIGKIPCPEKRIYM